MASDLVRGYIREIGRCQFKIPITPQQILNIIDLYQESTDKWYMKYVIADKNILSIDKSHCCINIIDDGAVSVYSESCIKPGNIFTWRLQIINLECDSFSSCPYIGLIIDNDRNLMNQLHDTAFDEIGYQFCGGSGYLFCIDWINRRFGNYKTFNKLWNKINDIIEITLDLNTYKIQIGINDNEKETVFQNIQKKKYRLILSVNECAGSVFRFI